MEQKPEFNTAMFGFNKQDVFLYIAKLIDKYEQEQNELKEQISSLGTQLEDKDALYEALVKKQAEAEGAQASSSAPEADSAIAQELAAQKNRADENEALAKDLQQKLSDMEQKYDSLNAKLREAFEELAEYHNQKQKIGSVMMRAQNEADIMIADATERKNQIIASTNEYIDNSKKKFEAYLSEVAAKQNSVKQSVSALSCDLDSMVGYIDAARSMFDSMAASVSENK